MKRWLVKVEYVNNYSEFCLMGNLDNSPTKLAQFLGSKTMSTLMSCEDFVKQVALCPLTLI